MFLLIADSYQRCGAGCGADGDHGRGQRRNVLFSAAKAAISASNALSVAAALSARVVSAGADRGYVLKGSSLGVTEFVVVIFVAAGPFLRVEAV
jgi:hypothetical protein